MTAVAGEIPASLEVLRHETHRVIHTGPTLLSKSYFFDQIQRGLIEYLLTQWQAKHLGEVQLRTLFLLARRGTSCAFPAWLALGAADPI